MPVLTTVIDDKSPLIVYDNTWLPGSSWDDQLASNYYLCTFTTNNVTDGSVSFNFNGTAIWLYGANRPNHGTYTTQVDSQSFGSIDGAGNNLFQQSLFNISSLSQGTHTIKLTNTASGNLYVDIDMIVWQSEVGNTDDQLVPEVIQDTDPRFQYQEPAWSTSSSNSNFNLNLFNNGSGHITQTYDASVTFTFTVRHALGSADPCALLMDISAEAISLFGTSGPSNGPYSVQLDAGTSISYNATNAYPTNYGVMIYHADNLGPGSHQVVLTNLPESSGQYLAVDYAQLWTTANATTSVTSPSSSASASPNKLSSGAIAGIAVAAVVALISACIAFYFYRRWRDALATHQDLYRVYALQQRGPPESLTVHPTGFSSSLETRSNASLMRNDNSALAFSGRAQQPADNPTAQNVGATQASSGSRDTPSIVGSANSPAQSPVDESFGRRPLPSAPGGLSLTTERPKRASSQRGQDAMTTDHISVVGSEAPPPNYTQAIGNMTTE